MQKNGSRLTITIQIRGSAKLYSFLMCHWSRIIDTKKICACHLVTHKRWVIFFNGIQKIYSNLKIFRSLCINNRDPYKGLTEKYRGCMQILFFLNFCRPPPLHGSHRDPAATGDLRHPRRQPRTSLHLLSGHN